MTPGFWSVARAVAWRNIHNFFTNPALIVPALLFPMFFFTAFAGGLSRVDQVPGFDYASGYTTFVYGFVLLQASTFGGIFTGFSIARDFESGFSRRLFMAAPRHGGLKIDGNAIDLVGLYTLAVFINTAAMLFGTGIAMRLRTMQAAPAMQMPAFLLLFLAPVWVPYDLLTGWVQAAASFNPITLMLEAGRGFLAGDPTKVLPAFGVAAVLAAVTVLWARGGLHSAERAA
jgi:ABC-2 type transport system permease protein